LYSAIKSEDTEAQIPDKSSSAVYALNIDLFNYEYMVLTMKIFINFEGISVIFLLCHALHNGQDILAGNCAYMVFAPKASVHAPVSST